MYPDPRTIGKIYSRIKGKVRQLDEALLNEFEPAISNIDQLRFQFFTKCVNDRHDNAYCFQEAQKMELRPDLEGAAKGLEQCINKAAIVPEWEKAGDACFVVYERKLRKDLQGEINRVLKSL